MSTKKIKRNNDGLVYSTNSDMEINDYLQDEDNTLPPQQQKLNIRLETKQRGGKKATLISGFIGKMQDLELLAKQLKNHCGCGGSVVENEILIQGEQIQKVKNYLQEKGYKTNKI